MKPLVSILIPAYNAERWIAETIRSALAQTWARREIIIVDDGSSDRTIAAAKEFASKDVLVVSQANQGAAAARNNAFSLCQGDFIQWLDADDLLAPDKVARQMNSLTDCQSGRTLLSSEWGYFLYRSSGAKFKPTRLWCDLSPIEWLLRKMGENLFMQPATWLVSRQLSEAAGHWDTRLSLDDDGEYFCRVLLASDGTHFVPGARMYYRRSGGGSLSNVGLTSKKLESQMHSIRLHLKYIQSLESSERVRTACLNYLQMWVVFFHSQRPDIIGELDKLAAGLGGSLKAPQLPWKYAWIPAIFGWRKARQAQEFLPRLRLSLLRSWDRALFRLENRTST